MRPVQFTWSKAPRSLSASVIDWYWCGSPYSVSTDIIVLAPCAKGKRSTAAHSTKASSKGIVNHWLPPALGIYMYCRRCGYHTIRLYTVHVLYIYLHTCTYPYDVSMIHVPSQSIKFAIGLLQELLYEIDYFHKIHVALILSFYFKINDIIVILYNSTYNIIELKIITLIHIHM